jgi:CRP/FNR family transcriptional regulator, anaerobic regulatory protein
MDFTTTSDAAVDCTPAFETHLPLRTPVAVSAGPCGACPVRQRCVAAGDEAESRRLCNVTIGRRRIRKGHAVYREGERFLFLYAVRFGALKSSMQLRNGMGQVTGFHLPGDLLGFDAMATGRHLTTLTALEESEVCALPYAQLTDGSADLHNLRQKVLQMAGAEVAREQRLLALIVNTHSEQRVAAFLLNLSERMEERGFSPHEFLLRMTRAEIGSYLGTTLETVSRSLSAFARRGHIGIRRRQVQLRNAAALRAEFEAHLP